MHTIVFLISPIVRETEPLIRIWPKLDPQHCFWFMSIHKVFFVLIFKYIQSKYRKLPGIKNYIPFDHHDHDNIDDIPDPEG